jgi:hypothetical protein
MSGNNGIPPRTNTPVFSLLAAILLIGLAIVGLVVVPDSRQNQLYIIVGLIVTTVPSLIAASYAERIGKDIRNGVLTQKVQEGAQAALDDTGVTDVVNSSQRGETTIVAMNALKALLEANTGATQVNTTATQHNTELKKEGNS